MRLLARLILTFSLLCGAAWAATTGTIQGTVTDPSGAAVPGASVRTLANATGYTRTAQSSATGAFTVPDLPPGLYTVTIEKAGFKKFVATDVPVKIAETYTLTAKLELGNVSEEVKVTAYPVKIDTTTMQLGADVTGSSLTDYPNLNRNWTDLQFSLPGAEGPASRLAIAAGISSFNGSREQSNDYLINGVDYNDIALNVPQEPPSPDAIGEVHIVDSTSNPEYGRNSGAIAIADIKSGTNSFHGNAFEFFRDTSLDSRSFFDPVPTPFHQNQFGGTIGGPIKKKKLFFFFSYQGTRQFAAQSQLDSNFNQVSIEKTPVFSANQFAGNWAAQGLGSTATGVFSLGVAPIAEYGDASSTCPAPSVGGSGPKCAAGTSYSSLFSTGAIPTEDFNPVAVNLLNAFPQTHEANTPGNFFTFPITGTLEQNQYLGRIDVNISPSDTFSFYGFWSRVPSNINLPFIGATLPGFGETDTAKTQQYTASEHHIFNANTLNDFRISYQRLAFQAVEPQSPTAPSSLGFTGINPQSTSGQGLPFIEITSFFNLGFSLDGPQPRVDDNAELADNFSYVRANHSYKFGVDIRRNHVFNPFFFENNGADFFLGLGPFSTGVTGADFELGFPDFYVQGSGNIINARAWEVYSYIQDQWRIRKNFTMTYGIGWDIETPLANLRNNKVGENAFRPGIQSKVFPTAPTGLLFPGDPGVPSPGTYRTHYNNFGPRLGFAWSPANNWSVRAGWSLNYDNSEEELTLQNLLEVPFTLTSFGAGFFPSPGFANPFNSVNTTTFCAAACGTPDQLDVSPVSVTPNPFPFTPPKPGSAVDFTAFEPFSINVIDPNFNLPYVMNYHLTVERQISPTMVATISYVGSQGRRLEAVFEGNPPSAAGTADCIAKTAQGCGPSSIGSFEPGEFAPLSTFGSVGTECTCTHSNYNALQLSVRKGFSHGLIFTAAYTYSHALDNISSAFEEGALDPFNFNLTYGDSAYDARHRFVATYLYRVPSIQRFAHFLPKRVADGWTFSGVVTFQTGNPFLLTDSIASSDLCNQAVSFFGCFDRPVAGKLRTFGDPRSAPNNEFFDPNSFTPEPPGVLGNAGRNPSFLHGPGINNWDLSVWKDTSITERTALQLRIDLFNAFNHAQFANPVSNVESSQFGQILQTRDNGRLLQLSAKFSF